jgi:hypothetical protein
MLHGRRHDVERGAAGEDLFGDVGVQTEAVSPRVPVVRLPASADGRTGSSSPSATCAASDESSPRRTIGR